MPPGPAYNWLCVAHSVLDVLSHAAQIRAAQAARAGAAVGATIPSRKRKRDESYPGRHTEWEDHVGRPSGHSAAIRPAKSSETILAREEFTTKGEESDIVSLSLLCLATYHYSWRSQMYTTVATNSRPEPLRHPRHSAPISRAI